MLTAIAVAFAFRCGLFNIGGQGQYWVGFIAALWVGTHVHGLPRLLHIVLAIAQRRSSPAASGADRRASSARPSGRTR